MSYHSSARVFRKVSWPQQLTPVQIAYEIKLSAIKASNKRLSPAVQSVLLASLVQRIQEELPEDMQNEVLAVVLGALSGGLD